jgi:hypothetical protein
MTLAVPTRDPADPATTAAITAVLGEDGRLSHRR